MPPTSMTVDAVVFDVGGTLLHVARDPQEAALERIAHLGVVSLDAFRAGVQAAVAEWRAHEYKPECEDLAATWTRHYERALAAAHFPGDCVEAARLLEEGFLSDGWELFPDAVPVLDAIRARGVRMGVVSNWPPSLEQTLERAGLRHYFDVVVSFGIVGFAKPHRRIFEIAAEALGLAPTQILYVGDDLEDDALGAPRAGMHAVLLDRRGRYELHIPRITELGMLEAFVTSGSRREQPNERCN
jgi:HAD superfamily hydrolase (TIGR01549 family)